MSTIEIPRFRWPLERGTNGKLITVEQNSPEHVRSCEWAIASCPQGFRPERPDFGWPWPLQRSVPLDPGPLLDALNRLEPRNPNRTAIEYSDLIDATYRHIEVRSTMASEGAGDDLQQPQPDPTRLGDAQWGQPSRHSGAIYPSSGLYPSTDLYPSGGGS